MDYSWWCPSNMGDDLGHDLGAALVVASPILSHISSKYAMAIERESNASSSSSGTELEMYFEETNAISGMRQFISMLMPVKPEFVDV
jgi:hypothetical protein